MKLKVYMVEFIGVFVLVLVGLIVVVLNLELFSIVLVFGFIFMVMIYVVGFILGGYFNFVVLFVMVLIKRLFWKDFGMYSFF